MVVTIALMACLLMEWLVPMVRWACSDVGGRRAGMSGSGFNLGDRLGGRFGSLGAVACTGLFPRVWRVWMRVVFHSCLGVVGLCVRVVSRAQLGGLLCPQATNNER